MTIAAGSRLGSHEVLSRLGAGGMGEVFLAHDTKLKRQVAIKVLPDAYARDPDRLSRFHREAQAVAALNHPNIAAIYDLEEAQGTTFLVLELIEGETLAERLARDPLTVDEAGRIARQILEALEAAHEKGICHRDLKPANIKITADGVIKVLDFGIAKFLLREKSDVDTTIEQTSPGVVLGTAGYMSPEQAKGQDADQRSDIFSFGCVFYELLARRPAFEGNTASETIANVLKTDVDIAPLSETVHPRILQILKRCLEKNPKQRWHAAADVRLELDAVTNERGSTEPVSAFGRVPLWQRAAAATVLAALAALAAGYAAWSLKPAPIGSVTRFSIPLPDGQQFSHVGRPVLAISRDGATLVYVANRRLFARPMSGTVATVIAGSEHPDGIQAPAISPDGQWVAFRSIGDSALKRLPISGGAPVTICPMDAPFGLSWSEQGLLFGQFGKGIMRVSPDGGTPEVIVPTAPGEMADSPQLLPGGKAVLFSVKKLDETWDRGRIAVQPLAGGARQTVLQDGAAAVYVPTGHLVYAVASVLFAIPFDVHTQAVRGGAVSIVEGLDRGFQATAMMGPATAQFAVSATGAFVFVPGSRAQSIGGRLDLGLFDPKGTPQPLGLPPAQYAAPRVSPDGKWAAVERIGTDTDIWIADLAGSAPIRRLTFGGTNRSPVWSGDSQWVIFQSVQEGRAGIFRQRADGSGTAERLTTPDIGFVHVPQSASPDGGHLLFTTLKAGFGEYTLWVLAMKDRRSFSFGSVQARSMVEAAFSPDGRWVAYSAGEAPESGNRVIQSFVQPFPASGAKYQIPGPTGAARPVWTTKGDAIHIGAAINRDSLIPVSTTPQFSFGQPDEIPRGARINGAPDSRRNHDPLPDGRILGVMTLGAGESGGQSAPQVAVVLNWFDELRQRVR